MKKKNENEELKKATVGDKDGTTDGEAVMEKVKEETVGGANEATGGMVVVKEAEVKTATGAATERRTKPREFGGGDEGDGGDVTGNAGNGDGGADGDGDEGAGLGGVREREERPLPMRTDTGSAALTEAGDPAALIVPGTTMTYEERIRDVCKAYEKKLGKDGAERLRKNVNVFTGLIHEIYRRVYWIRNYPDVERDMSQYWGHTSVIDDNDPVQVEAAFEEYVRVCGEYGYIPNVLSFCSFSGISRSTLQAWRDGTRRSLSPAHSAAATKIFDTCEGALIAKAGDGNPVGPIFLLKAQYKYSDGSNRVEIVSSATPETAEQIAARHIAAELPTRPDDI